MGCVSNTGKEGEGFNFRGKKCFFFVANNGLILSRGAKTVLLMCSFDAIDIIWYSLRKSK